MSCMGEPSTFLNQLRDYNLVPEELYKKVIKMKKKTRIQHGVYEILDWVEKERGALIKTFWECMFKDHIMHQYPIFQVFKNSMLDRPLIGCEKLPDVENPSRNEEVERKNEEQKKSLIEQQKSTKESDGEKPGPSSASSQENPTVNPSLSLLPVTCGDKKGMLCPDKFAKGEKCILTEGHWFTTGDFERISGKGENTTGAKRKFRKPLNPPDLKTMISSMEKPSTFLNQLRDYDLVPEELYQKVIKMKSRSKIQKGVYEILDCVEKTGGDSVKVFWSCVFKEHILHKYPNLRLILSSLMNESFRDCEKPPDVEKPSRNEDVEKTRVKPAQKKRLPKRRKSREETDEEEPGPSSASKLKKPDLEQSLSLLSNDEELPVTCGEKQGVLYPAKLVRGEMCILSEGHWFTPGRFETFSGKASSKKWKASIRYNNIPLQNLLKVNLSVTVKMQQENTKNTENMDTHCTDSHKPTAVEESMDEELREEEEEEIEAVDMALFELGVLPVSCGSVSGDLYKSRFVGPHTKSIRTEERWFTPVEFVKQEMFLPDGHWSKHVLCHGKTLRFLVKKKILSVHPVLCPCPLCQPKNKRDQDNDDVCYICNSGLKLVCCDECPRAFHHRCHLPPLQDDSLGDEWMCTFCVFKSNHSLWMNMSREDVLRSPVSKNTMRCEYLLLRLFKADTLGAFTYKPAEKVERYHYVISNPMWLKRVRSKLQKKKYKRVGEFVRDIELIFSNYQTFNWV
ncbi:nuclear body protein SP140-like protein [Silurus asotus]|uniref:Nuclear body protein SP140-like protein n=1 Tax=Silurus asotus TaxID=30991 RepID=A0AAD5ATD0_SILAS|nr:nuclear body protein SP140-like protein [Silurus asotus]